MNENPQVAKDQVSHLLEAIVDGDNADAIQHTEGKPRSPRIITRRGITKNKSRKASKVHRIIARRTKQKARR